MTKVITLATFASAAAASLNAEAATSANTKDRREKAVTMFTALVGHFATDKAATVEAVLPIMFGAEKWKDYAATVQSSRRTEIATVFEVARREPLTATSVIKLVADTKRPFRSTFLQTITFCKNNPKVPTAVLKDRIENPPASEPTDGDAMERIMMGVTQLFQSGSVHFAAIREYAAGIQRYYKEQRNAGSLQTSAEIKAAARKAAKSGEIDFTAVKPVKPPKA